MFDFDKAMHFKKKNYDVLTAGELLVDLISAEYGDSFQGDTYHKHFGGSPSNIAMNLRKLGKRSIVASAVGDDLLGQFLIGKLRQEGINTSCIQTVDHPTSLVLVTKSKATPIPVFYRGADYYLDYTPAIEEALIQSRIVHFSCWPISMLPVRGTIEKILGKAKEQGLLVGFDPNYHSMIWRKGENGVQLVKEIISQADIVKPSEDDAERLFGKDTPENQLAKFLELGPGLVILTLGKDGAIVSNGSETVRFEAFPTEVVDTTGAGDAFWSGFYAAFVSGRTVREALRAGFAVSAYKLQYTGAVVDLPNLEQIEKMYG